MALVPRRRDAMNDQIQTQPQRRYSFRTFAVYRTGKPRLSVINGAASTLVNRHSSSVQRRQQWAFAGCLGIPEQSTGLEVTNHYCFGFAGAYGSRIDISYTARPTSKQNQLVRAHVATAGPSQGYGRGRAGLAPRRVQVLEAGQQPKQFLTPNPWRHRPWYVFSYWRSSLAMSPVNGAIWGYLACSMSPFFGYLSRNTIYRQDLWTAISWVSNSQLFLSFWDCEQSLATAYAGIEVLFRWTDLKKARVHKVKNPRRCQSQSHCIDIAH